MDPTVEDKVFRKEERELFVFRVGTAAFYLATPLVLSFWLVDLLFAYEYRWLFLQARLLSIPVSIIAYSLYKMRVVRERYYLAPMQVIFWYLGIYNAFLVSKTGYELSSYYAGLNLAAGGALSFLPLSWFHTVLLALACYAPYIVVVLSKTGAINWGIFGANLAFCGSTLFIGITTNIFTRMIRFREFQTRKKLEREISTKDEVITRKTQEGIFLEKLTNQFSPQVIDAVKKGNLAIDGLIRREITCVFVDVESSTSRSIRIDRDDYTNIMSEFFGIVSEIFIRHDVTVGTYLGDGMLAFGNAPQDQPNHRLETMNACLEVLRVHSSRRKYYMEKWRSPFNIRIGINAGFAYVGFFPNFKRGTYTALGSSVNLAARLCSRAPENAILVTKAFAKSLAADLRNTIVTQVGELNNIKGFEGESFELFSVVPSQEALNAMSSQCPLCSGKLRTENDLGDSYLVKCIVCGYSDIIERGVVDIKSDAA